jgi:hypothetical protein
MTKLTITTNLHGELTSSSRDQLHSFFKSVAGPFAPVLVAAALPKIEAELKSRAATIRQSRVGLTPSVYTNSYGTTVLRLPPAFIAALRNRHGGSKAAPRFISLFK